jgi:predicted  nucleic acid-binding Zn-ribbon protein
MSQEEQDLATHVSLCHLRYKQLEEKLDAFNDRLTKVETDISAIKSQMSAGFTDIKLLLEKQSNARTIQIIATIGTVVAAALGAFGYFLHK